MKLLLILQLEMEPGGIRREGEYGVPGIANLGVSYKRPSVTLSRTS